jgi:cytochrome c-type biogenesis protein CcmH/NrfF
MELFSFILLQEGPAETTNYMILGYSVIFIVLAIYLVSLYVRRRNLMRDEALLEEIEEQGGD